MIYRVASIKNSIGDSQMKMQFSLLLLVFIISAAKATSTHLNLKDVTKQFTYRDAIVTPFQNLYSLESAIHAPETAASDILYAFHFDVVNYNEYGNEVETRRLEVFSTIGDEMGESIIYFVTDAPQAAFNKDGSPVRPYRSERAFELTEARYYLIKDLSPADGNGGSQQPGIEPSAKNIKKFIMNKFLKENGRVSDEFKPACASIVGRYLCEDHLQVLEAGWE